MSTPSTTIEKPAAAHVDVVLDLIDRTLAECDRTTAGESAQRFAALLDEHGLR